MLLRGDAAQRVAGVVEVRRLPRFIAESVGVLTGEEDVHLQRVRLTPVGGGGRQRWRCGCLRFVRAGGLQLEGGGQRESKTDSCAALAAQNQKKLVPRGMILVDEDLSAPESLIFYNDQMRGYSISCSTTRPNNDADRKITLRADCG